MVGFGSHKTKNRRATKKDIGYMSKIFERVGFAILTNRCLRAFEGCEVISTFCLKNV